MKALLGDGRAQALLATARAIATALQDRPQLLELRAGQPASGEMELILKSLGRAESRIWIVDQHQRLLALVGDLKKTARQDAPADLSSRLIRPIASLVLERPTENFDDALPEQEMANDAVAVSAVAGGPNPRSRQSPHSRAVILSASQPGLA